MRSSEQNSQEIKKNNEEIDDQLVIVSNGLNELKIIAEDMKQELNTQKEILNETNNHTEQTVQLYVTQNQRLLQFIQHSGSLNKCGCVMFIMLVFVVVYVLSQTL